MGKRRIKSSQIYAAMAIALHRLYGFGYERINRALEECPDIWEEIEGCIDEMAELCEKETGVTVIFKNPEGQE